MNNKALLIGGAVALYLLRDHIAAALGFHATATDPAQVTPTTTGSSSAATGSSSQTTTTAPAGVWPQVQALGAQQAATLSPDQWLYTYRVFRGADTTAPEDIGLQHDRLYTFSEFQAAMQAKGLNGLRGVGAAAAPAKAPQARANAQAFGRRAWGY